MKELGILKDRATNNLSLLQGSKKIALFFSILFLIWAAGLIYLLANQATLFNGGKLISPLMYFPVVGFIAAIIAVAFYLLKDAFFVVNHFILIFDPKIIARKMFFAAIFFSIFWIGFLGIFIAWGLFSGTILGMIGAVLGFLLLCWAIYDRFRKVVKSIKMAVNYEVSELELSNYKLKIGEVVQGHVKNNSLKLNGQHLIFTLRNLSEKYVSKNDNSVFKTIILNASTLSVIHKDGISFFEFTLDPENAKPTRLEKNIADYWELEVKNDRNDFYARFILDVT